MDDAGVRSEGREFFARVTLLTDIPLNNQKTDPKILPTHSQISIMADNLTDAHCQNHLTTRVSRKKKKKIRVSSCRNRNSENYTVTPTTVP